MQNDSNGHSSRRGLAVLIVDGDAEVHLSLHRILAGCASFTLLADAKSASQALQQAQRLHPSLVILVRTAADYRLRLFIRRLRRIVPEVPVFLLIDPYDLRTEQQAFQCEVTAVFSASEDPASVLANALDVCGEREPAPDTRPDPRGVPRCEPRPAQSGAGPRYLAAV